MLKLFLAPDNPLGAGVSPARHRRSQQTSCLDESYWVGYVDFFKSSLQQIGIIDDVVDY